MGALKFKTISHSDSNYMVTRQKGKGIKLSEDVRPKKSDAGNVVFTVWEFYIKAATEEPLRTDPAPVASWKGSFMLKDEKTRIGFQAHLTSEGYSKVNEISRNMPEVLEFELCPYQDFLRTVFKGCEPDDKDIGLYFFPNDNARPDGYMFLLQQLSRNLFLRSYIDGVELLVFTSKVLQKEYRKRNKSYFLWGLYRRRHGKRKGAFQSSQGRGI
ncbi:PHD finger-containing protein 1 isoform X2 [Daucus carota subsp. sativus]|nr:PREDICTED: uncharacterized protein LOC108214554 isoform X2 [Daucus carota subsp. sativus]XP_017242107.1 PREDICTED: uncharacterized protein LOC108214554 isoform X2 [Daucus carota subsp. sativus]